MRKPRTSSLRPRLELTTANASTAVVAPIPPPPSRGRLWYDFQIADEFFEGLPNIGDKVRWVRSHLPREKRIKIGQQSAWYETDILRYIESQREDERAKRRETA